MPKAAGKKQVSRQEQAAAKEAKKAKVAKAKENAALLDQLDIDEASAKQTESKRFRSDQDKFDKCIADNFPGWCEEDLTMVFSRASTSCKKSRQTATKRQRGRRS